MFSPTSGVKSNKGLLTPILLSFALSIGAVSAASAFSPGIKLQISKASLKSKCKSAGGQYSEEGNFYQCTIARSNGQVTTVSCDETRQCIGVSGKARTRSFVTSRIGAIAIR